MVVPLSIGTPAPPLLIDDWIRGSPLTQFEPDTIYVIEFFATWCSPCKKMTPTLMQISEAYRGRKVEVIGVASAERAPTRDAAVAAVASWVADHAPNINYRIAVDYSHKTDALWRVPWFPYIVIVDGRGSIAATPLPFQLPRILPKIIDDRPHYSDQ
nr:TlpA disulfide reductase family protein [Bradyrhizobium aeschynomenes]